MNCSQENCDKPARGLGLCGMHYARLRRHGDPSVVLQEKFVGWFSHKVEALRETGAPRPGVGEVRIHTWLSDNYAKTGRCEWCARTNRRTQWASANGHRYTRNRADYLELCVPCHTHFDGHNRGKSLGRKHSAETREKIAAAQRGRRLDAAARTKLSEGHLRYYATHSIDAQWRANISEGKRRGAARRKAEK